MSFVTGEVIPNPGGAKPYKVVFRHQDGKLISEIEVDTIAEGERLIVEMLRALGDFARRLRP